MGKNSTNDRVWRLAWCPNDDEDVPKRFSTPNYMEWDADDAPKYDHKTLGAAGTCKSLSKGASHFVEAILRWYAKPPWKDKNAELTKEHFPNTNGSFRLSLTYLLPSRRSAIHHDTRRANAA